ncbi:hypothetical protein GW17_00013091 [Ensete ventricosum]|nr:hypothetical protein GW17_00013091 [Ensete ventricosum]
MVFSKFFSSAGRGVDLNRNWGVDWGKKEKIKRDWIYIFLYSFSGLQALFMPYDHKNTTPDGHMSNLMELLLWDVNRIHFEEKCLVGSGGGLVGYLAHGTTTDYMYDIVKVPMAFTFEVISLCGSKTVPLPLLFRLIFQTAELGILKA